MVSTNTWLCRGVSIVSSVEEFKLSSENTFVDKQFVVTRDFASGRSEGSNTLFIYRICSWSENGKFRRIHFVDSTNLWRFESKVPDALIVLSTAFLKITPVFWVMSSLLLRCLLTLDIINISTAFYSTIEFEFIQRIICWESHLSLVISASKNKLISRWGNKKQRVAQTCLQ